MHTFQRRFTITPLAIFRPEHSRTISGPYIYRNVWGQWMHQKYPHWYPRDWPLHHHYTQESQRSATILTLFTRIPEINHFTTVTHRNSKDQPLHHNYTISPEISQYTTITQRNPRDQPLHNHYTQESYVSTTTPKLITQMNSRDQPYQGSAQDFLRVGRAEPVLFVVYKL